MSESVMTWLIEKGMNRQEAHELLRKLTIDSERENRPFKEILSQNSGIQKFLTSQDIDNALKPEKYLGTAITQVELMIKKTQHEREVRG